MGRTTIWLTSRWTGKQPTGSIVDVWEEQPTGCLVECMGRTTNWFPSSICMGRTTNWLPSRWRAKQSTGSLVDVWEGQQTGCIVDG